MAIELFVIRSDIGASQSSQPETCAHITLDMLTFGLRWLQRRRRCVHTSVSTLWKDRVETGVLRYDEAQERAGKRLSRLQDALDGFDNRPWIQFRITQEQQLRENQEKEKEQEEEKEEEQEQEQEQEKEKKLEEQLPRIPRGLYIFGEVGNGKSMLMDMFFEHAPSPRKRRVHFHAFLQDVHQRIHRLKQEDLKNRGRNFHIDTSLENNPVVRVGRALACEDRLSLLCLDEFQVTDIADAMILSQLFSTLFQHGIVLVATSNRAPTELYEGGINRSYFLPFIDQLQKHCVVHQLQSAIDYRRLLSVDMDNYYFVDHDEPSFAPTRSQMDQLFDDLLDGKQSVQDELSVSFGRTLIVERAHPNGVAARFRFDELCQRELGAADYRALAQQYQIVLLGEIPQLTLKEHNEARRFIHLVDELYENKCKMLISAAKEPHALLTLPEPAEGSNKSLADNPVIVRQLKAEFPRTASRLVEMCSRGWWEPTREP